MARRLQAQYDREIAEQVVNQPDEASMRRMAGQAFNSSSRPSAAEPAAGPQSGQSTPGQGTSERPAPGFVGYPAIGSATGKQLAFVLLLPVCSILPLWVSVQVRTAFKGSGRLTFLQCANVCTGKFAA